MKSEADTSPYNRSSQHPPLHHDTLVKVTLVARPLLTPVAQKLCRCEHYVFTSGTCAHSRKLIRVEIVCCCSEAFSSSYPDTEVPNKTTMHRPVTTFRDTGSACDRKHGRCRTVLTGEGLLVSARWGDGSRCDTHLLYYYEFYGERNLGSALWPP
jgi:hypothetical protein